MRKEKRTLDKEFTDISIPTSLFEKIKEQIKGTEFTSVSEYVTYVLGEIIAEDEERKSSSGKDEEKVKARLKALGYID